MALPGLSFEIVRSDAPVVGLRSDRTAILAQTQRGRVERPVLVHSHDEFVREYGEPVDGMLGAIAAKAYFDNGGRDLLVCRFAEVRGVEGLSGARAATGTIPAADGGGVLALAARDPGAFGNAIQVDALLTVLATALGSVDPLGLDTVVFAADLPIAVPVGSALRISTASGTSSWATVVTSTPTVLTFAPPLASVPAPTPPAPNVSVDVFAPTFSLRVQEPLRADVVVTGLDYADVPAMQAKLEPFAVTVTGATSGTVALPTPGIRVRLTGGLDGLEAASLPGRASSFRRCIAAVRASELPDVVIAPDLWSAVWGAKLRTDFPPFGFARADADDLADELVRSVADAHERVVLLDPPLTGYDAVDQRHARPVAVSELLAWRDVRTGALGSDRDFVGTMAPWIRVVAGPVVKGDDTLLVPPSAFVAGRMARTARERGPWVATGNVALEGAVGLSAALSVREEESLQDVGICPLRTALPRGVTLQGVRSLACPDRPSWQFLSTRRLFNFLRRALRPIGLSYTFEPNSPPTWIALRRDLERLMTDLYRRGALAGSAPSQAFFVRVDESLNPEAARENGVLTAQVGLAPAVPLEFLVVRLIASRTTARVEEEAT